MYGSMGAVEGRASDGGLVGIERVAWRASCLLSYIGLVSEQMWSVRVRDVLGGWLRISMESIWESKRPWPM